MPLTKRAVSPVNVSLHRIPGSVQKDELECVANGTLANLVRQLSSISRHAENIFGEIYHEAVKLDHKSNTLAQRVERLTTKVTQLDGIQEQGKSFKISKPSVVMSYFCLHCLLKIFFCHILHGIVEASNFC